MTVLQSPASSANLQCRITAFGVYPVCAIYRFEIPLRAMIARGWCGGVVYGAAGGASPDGDGFAITAGDPVLTQRLIALDASTIEMLHVNRCPFVHDIDDLLWAIPADNPGATDVGAELLANMDASLRRADLVTTSTEPLAAALERRGIPAVIIPNLLDSADWSRMPNRADRSRLRIGWYGQRDVHVADLALIEDVVTPLERDVDFVFYGDVPGGLRSRSHDFETHAAMTPELFPATLASLDLDIVLAPLAKNEFNECKSNLRILQAGMLGYAVIATDIEAHRGLPVTRVENTPAAWIRAIRARIGEQDSVRADGDELQQAVHERFIINDRSAERIFTTWTRRAPPDVA